MPHTPSHNLFLDFLEQDPNLAFQGFSGQFGRSPSKQRFFQNSFQNIHNKFLGNLSRQIMGGQAPTGRFSDFLKDFDFGGYAAAQSPRARGLYSSQYAPSTRFLFNF